MLTMDIGRSAGILKGPHCVLIAAEPLCSGTIVKNDLANFSGIVDVCPWGLTSVVQRAAPPGWIGGPSPLPLGVYRRGRTPAPPC